MAKLVDIPNQFTLRWDPVSSVYLAIGLGGALFLAGLGVVLGVKVFLKK